MSFKLDLAKMKYLKSDANSTTLRHPAGHTVTIAHNVLGPNSRAALQALSKIPQQSETPLQADTVGHQMLKNRDNMAEGGTVDNPVATEAARASQRGGVPSDSPVNTGDWSHIWKADGGEVELAQGGNAGEQRKKIFGSQSSPSKPDMREKHMEHIRNFAKTLLHQDVKPSGGKIDPKTGERRDDSPEQGVDKPDWRSVHLESQSDPDAMMHEIAHLMLLPKGVGLAEGQKLMDKQYSEVQKQHGYMKQKRSQGEIQPMAAEQILRRHLGLPANKNAVPVKEGEGPRTAVDTGELAGTRVQQGAKTVDLIRQSRFLSPENRQRLEHVMSGKLKFHSEHGWQENPDALGAKTQMYKEEHPEAVKRQAAAEGGPIYKNPELAKKGWESIKSKAPDEASRARAHESFQRADKQLKHLDEGGEVCHACGGQIHKMAGGGLPDTSNISTQQPPIPQELMGNSQYQGPDPEQPVIGPATQQVGNWLMSPTGAPEVTPQDVAATKADAVVDQSAAQQDQAQQTADAAHQQAAAATPTGRDFSPQGMAEHGIQAETAGAAGQAAAAGTIADQQAQTMALDAARKQDIAKHYQNSFDELNTERQNHIYDIQHGYVDPNNYWLGMKDPQTGEMVGGHSKIAAGIGMILAGFNPTNRPNAAIEFLNHQMDMNIDAQKNNLAAKNNMLAMNLQQFHNLHDATDMTKVLQADMVKSQLEQAALQSGSAMAKAQAQSAIGAIDAKYQPIFMQLQLRRTMQGLGQGGTTAPGSTGAGLSYLDQYAPEQAKNYRERYYAPFDMPGGKSIADRPIPEDERKHLNAMTVLDQKGRDVINFVHQHSGTWNPQTRNVATQKVEEMKNFYNDSISGGALTEGRLGWYDEQFKKHPTDILAQLVGNTKKMQEMVDSNANRKNITLQSYGLRPPAISQTQPQYKTVGGVTYMRGPNGEPIRVK